MRETEKNDYKKFFIDISEKINTNSQEKFEDTFFQILNLLELPRPSKELEKYFAHPSIIKSLLINALSHDKLTRDDRIELQPYLTKALKKLNNHKDKYFVRYRVLNPEGIYPNFELNRKNCHYSIQNQLPIIWTKNKISIDSNILDSSVINWLTRNELKLATAILCSGEGQRFYLYFTGYNTVEIGWDCISKIPDNLKTIFLKEYFELNIKFTPIGVRPWNRVPIYDSTYYKFKNFENHKNSFEKIFDKISIQDELLLRTCNYFVKSIMHWENTINAEEAIANVFFCLEGCLHLIQKKYGDFDTRLNFKLLKSVFNKEIENGENLLNFIKDGYSTRITLVHPEPAWGAEWKPFVCSDDFYEYFRICRSLLNFILIDEYKEY
ncbi:hypothetical protein [Winogradskyella arenosi]|uniref:Apea-like HEPN domain-containing protein n=1 Tax=Winogradskyella arenosi TaxID=533325 RepID=A0A368ZAD7_9FLAO|nr:hypothetical protein [Winogradskyella arenosi]RCW89718.1 hypothetical protein DFQ08_1153 [Winogradskyella arenosi]